MASNKGKTGIRNEVQQAPDEDDFNSNSDIGKLKGEEEASTTKAEAAVALKVSGATDRQISEILNYSHATAARTAYTRALAESVPEEDRVVQRKLASRRLERILGSLSKKAHDTTDDEHLAYAKVSLLYIDRLIKLHGADAPSQVNVTYSPAREEIDRAVKAITAAATGGEPDEFDVIEGDIL